MNTTFRIIDAERAANAIELIAGLPADGSMEVEVREYKADRSLAQNKLAFLWYREIGKQTHHTANEARNYCKWTFGLPILALCEEFNDDLWRDVFKRLNYEDRLSAMELMQVTRMFTVKQFTEYLESIERHYQSYEIMLPHPEYLWIEALAK